MTTQLTPNRMDLPPPYPSALIVGVSAVLATAGLAFVLHPFVTTAFVVLVLGGVAAVIALAALAAIVRMVVTDVWSDVRRALERRARRRSDRTTERGATMTPVAPLGRHLAAYHATRRAR